MTKQYSNIDGACEFESDCQADRTAQAVAMGTKSSNTVTQYPLLALTHTTHKS